MKKVLITVAFALLCIFSFGQTVHKGSLLGLHIFTPTFQEGVTMEDYVKFYTTKAIPAYEKAFPGTKMYLIKSVRGQDSSSIGVIFMFNDEAHRNKYFNNDGTMTEAGTAASAKLNDIRKEFEKYEVQSNAPDKYNDWVVL
jgi:hypothetical protein